MDRMRLKEKLKELVTGEVFFDEPMSRHTSIGVGGKADALLFPQKREELARVIACLRQAGVAYLPVGNCTNLIVRDGGFRGVLISLRDLREKNIRPDEGGAVCLCADAGVPLSDMVRLSVEESLTGMEFCAGIPGTVGGGVRMNAGAYGREMKDIVRAITLINGTGRERSVGRGQLRFAYRNLDLPEDAVVVGAEFLLQKGPKDRVQSKVNEIVALRKAKHPLQYRSAGSVFKNPGHVPAGRLIDEAGLKGCRIGDAAVSEEHGNFIVNRGAARAKDILALIERVEEEVFLKRGVRLEREVKIIGEEEERA
jgi:UDP-N-acetylmuramate dehydrogenase